MSLHQAKINSSLGKNYEGGVVERSNSDSKQSLSINSSDQNENEVEEDKSNKQLP